MHSTQRAGLALIVGAVAILGVTAVHPTGREAAGGGYGFSTLVHAVAILAELVLLLGTLGLTARLAQSRDTAVAAFVCYAAATMLLIVAAIAAGWLDPSIAATINRSFATVGFGLSAIAMALWSVAMWRTRLSRAAGAFGIATATFTLFGVGHGVGLELHGFGGAVMIAFALWMGWAGLLLRLDRPTTA